MRYFRKMVGKRIFLSPINPDDVETYTQFLNTFETVVPLGLSTQTISIPKERDVLERMAKDDHQFAIVRYDGESERLIGNCGFNEYNANHRRGTIGIFIGDADSRGKGYGTEAIMLLLEYGFGLLNLENIMLTVAGYNTRGIKCYEKCGFKVIGRRRSANFINGEPYDDIYMDILSSEFDRDIRDRLPMYFHKEV